MRTKAKLISEGLKSSPLGLSQLEQLDLLYFSKILVIFKKFELYINKQNLAYFGVCDVQ